jgi:diguanylate cyclase (GGDEF)-like protein
MFGQISTTVRLLSDDQAWAARMAAALADEALHVVSEGPLPADCDVVVIGPGGSLVSPIDGDALRSTGRIGVIVVGGEQPADVRLPADVSASELRLACQLLGEIVRLKRRVRGVEQAHDIVSREARTDPLTGLPNRRAWDEALSQRAAAWQADPRPGCVAVVDLDHFKLVNDRHGHTTGDAVLRVSAQAWRSAVRQSDFVARLGGDEFGLLLIDLLPARAPNVLERIRQAATQALAIESLPPVTASLGFFVIANSGGGSPADWYAHAASALGQAKAAGRDRAVAAS